MAPGSDAWISPRHQRETGRIGPFNEPPLMRRVKSARDQRCSGSEQRQRYHGDAVWAAVGVASCREDYTVGDRFGAELRVKPVQVPNITIADCLAEFHLDRYDSAIVAFNDQIDLVVGLLGAQMADPGERGLGVGSPTPRRSASLPTPTSLAAKAGSTRWCLGAFVSRFSGLNTGIHAGTGSSKKIRARWFR